MTDFYIFIAAVLCSTIRGHQLFSTTVIAMIGYYVGHMRMTTNLSVIQLF